MSAPQRWALRAAVVAALLAVFVAWRNPHFMVDLTNVLWSCFG